MKSSWWIIVTLLVGIAAIFSNLYGTQPILSILSTTTVIMKTLGSEDEGVCGAHDVDNGFDEPRTASCVGMLTRVTAIQANAQVRATQSPISGALPAPSVQQAHRFPCFFFLLAELGAGQPGMGHHRERDMAIPAVPEAHFILIQAGLPFGLFNALLHRVAGGSHPHQRLERGLRWG